MLRNYFKIAFRNLLKDKVHASINLLGLSFGLASTILISLWIKRELGMNSFHANADRVFRIMENQQYGGEIATFAATPGPLAAHLKAHFPEITHATRATWTDRGLIAVGDKSFFEKCFYTEPDFFKIFSFPIVKGDQGQALAEPGNVFLSSSLSEKLFGTTDPIGQTVRLSDAEDYKVAGVFADVPSNSTLKFDFLLPFVAFEKNNEWSKDWHNNSFRTFFMTSQPIAGETMTVKLKDVLKDHQDNAKLLAQPLPDWYLRSDFKNGQYSGRGQIMLVKMFGIIAVFLLAIACINFMNLATAKSINRAKEVGVRKVSGATRGSVAAQFLAESSLMAVAAGLLGAAVASMALPYFNQMFELDLKLNEAGMSFWLGMAGIVALVGMLAGSYPAAILSAFAPITVLKGGVSGSTASQGSAVRLRKILVTAQFVIATVLIISTIVIYKQMQYMRNVNLGYERENLVYVPVNGKLFEEFDNVKRELLQFPGIKNVSSSNGEIHQWGNNNSSVTWPGKDPNSNILFQHIPVGYDFIETIGATMKAGRDFSPEFPNDSTAFIINETAAKTMGLENPVGEQISMWGKPGRIIGLVNDFHVGGMHSSQDNVILILRPWKNYFYVRLAANTDVSATLANMESLFRRVNPAFPFEYRFCDKEYLDNHQSDIRVGELSKVFAFLTIFISCLGLFGLATFATSQRTKEIGIRKVLGASVSSVVRLLSFDFLKLVLYAFVLASPIAWYFMKQWLEDFNFRISLNGWMFLTAGAGALAIAFFTVSFQSIKAALANPVQSLRSE